MPIRLLSGLVTIVLLSLPASAAAQDPAATRCTQYEPFLAQEDLPTQAAIGRPFEVSLFNGTDSLTTTSFQPLLLGYLKGAFTGRPGNGGTFVFQPGDTVGARITMTARSAYRDTCQTTFVHDVRLVPSRPVKVLEEKTYGFDGSATWLLVTLDPGDCLRARDAPIRLTLSGAASRSWMLADACGNDWKTLTTRATSQLRFGLAGYQLSTDGLEPRVPHLLIKTQPKRQNVRRTYRLTITQGATRIRTIRFRAAWSWSRGARVWQETDDFVNYCINQNRNIYSEGGRLYCTFPEHRGVALGILRH